jgi:hypothetical protein
MSTPAASAWPDGIASEHAREVSGWRRHASPLSLLVLGAVVALALAGVLGHERVWQASANGARLSVHMPETIRNGEFLEIRITVDADADIGDLAIGIGAALWEDTTVNTMVPAPTEESSEDGEFRFTFGHLAAGTSFLLKVDAQINPDILGGNGGTVTVYDGTEVLVSTDIDMMVLP